MLGELCTCTSASWRWQFWGIFSPCTLFSVRVFVDVVQAPAARNNIQPKCSLATLSLLATRGRDFANTHTHMFSAAALSHTHTHSRSDHRPIWAHSRRSAQHGAAASWPAFNQYILCTHEFNYSRVCVRPPRPPSIAVHRAPVPLTFCGPARTNTLIHLPVRARAAFKRIACAAHCADAIRVCVRPHALAHAVLQHAFHSRLTAIITQPRARQAHVPIIRPANRPVFARVHEHASASSHHPINRKHNGLDAHGKWMAGRARNCLGMTSSGLRVIACSCDVRYVPGSAGRRTGHPHRFSIKYAICHLFAFNGDRTRACCIYWCA